MSVSVASGISWVLAKTFHWVQAEDVNTMSNASGIQKSVANKLLQKRPSYAHPEDNKYTCAHAAEKKYSYGHTKGLSLGVH